MPVLPTEFQAAGRKAKEGMLQRTRHSVVMDWTHHLQDFVRTTICVCPNLFQLGACRQRFVCHRWFTRKDLADCFTRAGTDQLQGLRTGLLQGPSRYRNQMGARFHWCGHSQTDCRESKPVADAVMGLPHPALPCFDKRGMLEPLRPQPVWRRSRRSNKDKKSPPRAA